MKKTWMTLTILAAGVALAGPALADEHGRTCSVEDLAGSWLFATDVGQIQQDFPFIGDITALGSVHNDRDGNFSGVFDVTVAQTLFFPDVPFTGFAIVDPDCTGTFTFVTAAGTERTDSVAIVSKDEIWGMSQDPSNLWTWRARRVSGQPRQ